MDRTHVHVLSDGHDRDRMYETLTSAFCDHLKEEQAYNIEITEQRIERCERINA